MSWWSNVQKRRCEVADLKQKLRINEVQQFSLKHQLLWLEQISYFGSFPYRIKYRELVDRHEEHDIIRLELARKGWIYILFGL